MAWALRCLVLGLVLAHAAGYCRDNPPATIDPTTTLTYYKQPQDSTKSIYDKCKSLGTSYAGPPNEGGDKKSYDVAITISSPLKDGEQSVGYKVGGTAQNTLEYNTAKIKSTIETVTTMMATVNMYPHAGYACVKMTDLVGNNVSLSGDVKVSIRFPRSIAFPEGMVKFGASDADDEILMTHSYDIGGRTGPQVVSLSESLEPKLAVKGNANEIKWIYGGTSRILLYPFDGDPTSQLTPHNGAVLKGFEFFLPFADKPAPMAPSVKEASFNKIKLIFPLYDMGNEKVEMWNYTFAPAGSDLYTCVEDAEPGKELVIDGLSPSTTFRFEARSTIPPINMWANATSNTYSFDMMTGARGGSAGEVRWAPVGTPETFRKDETTAVVRIPGSIVRGNPRVAQADITFQDPLTNRVFKRMSVNSGGVFVVPGVNMKAGFKVKYTITDQVGFQSNFNESMLLYTNETKPGAGASQLNDDPIKTGPPAVLRTGPKSMLIRLPNKVSGYTAPVVYANISLADAVSGEVLLANKRRANATKPETFGLPPVDNETARGTDVYIANLPDAPSQSYAVQVTTVDENGQKAAFSYVLNPTDPSRPTTLGVRTQANHHQPAFQLAGKLLQLQTPHVVKVRKGADWESHDVDHTVYNATNALTGATLGTTTIRAGGASALLVPEGTPLVLVTHTYGKWDKDTPVLTTTDVVVRDPLEALHTNDTLPSIVQISKSMSLLRVPYLTTTMQREKLMPVNEYSPIEKVLWRIMALNSSVPTVAEAEAYATLQEELDLLDDTLWKNGAGIARVGETLMTKLPAGHMWNIKMMAVLNNEDKIHFTLVPPVPLPLTTPLLAEPSAVTVTTHMTSVAQEMRRVVVVRLPARRYIGNQSMVAVKIFATPLADDILQSPPTEVTCGCLDTSRRRVPDMQPACGAEQTPEPCDEGVELQCVLPYVVVCAVSNTTATTNTTTLTRMDVVEAVLKPSTVATDHVVQLHKKWALMDGLVLSATTTPIASNNDTAKAPEAAEAPAHNTVSLAHMHTRINTAQSNTGLLDTSTMVVECDPTRQLQELLTFREFDAGVVGPVEFMPACGGVIVRVPPLVKPRSTRLPMPPDFVMDYNMTVYNMGVNGTTGVMLYRKSQLTACGATEVPMKGCGMAALALPTNVTSKVVIHLNMSESNTEIQTWTAIVPPAVARAPYLHSSPIEGADWKGSEDTLALAGVGLYPSALNIGRIANKTQSVGVTVRLDVSKGEVAMVLKNANATSSAGEVTMFAAGTGDSLVSLPQPAPMPRKKGTVGRMSLRMSIGGEAVTIGITDQALLESAASLHALPKQPHGLPTAHRAPPGKVGGLAVVRVPTGLQSLEDGLTLLSQCSAQIKVVALEATSPANGTAAITTAANISDTMVAMTIGQDNVVSIPAALFNVSMWVIDLSVFATYTSKMQVLGGGPRGTNVAEVVFRVTGSYGFAHYVHPVAAMPRITASVTGTVRVDCPSRFANNSVSIVSCTISSHDLNNGFYNYTTTVMAGGSYRFALPTGHTHNVTVSANPSTFNPKDSLVTDQAVPFPSLLEGPAVNKNGTINLVPLCPALMIRIPELIVNSSGHVVDCTASGGRFVLTVKDTYLQVRINEFALHAGGDTVVPITGANSGLCCNETCKALIKCAEVSGRRRTVQDITVVAPPATLIKDPTQPQAYTNSCTALAIVNPRKQRVDFAVSAPGLPTTTGTLDDLGVFSVDELEPTTTYMVVLTTSKSTATTRTKTMMCSGVSSGGVDEETGALSFSSDYLGQRPVVAIAPALGGVGVNCPEAFGGRDTASCRVALRLSPSSPTHHSKTTNLILAGQGEATQAECCAVRKEREIRAEVQAAYASQLEDELTALSEGNVEASSATMTSLLPDMDTQFQPGPAEIERIFPTPQLGTGPGQYATQEELEIAVKGITWARQVFSTMGNGAVMPEPVVTPAVEQHIVETVLKLSEPPAPATLDELRAKVAARAGVSIDQVTMTVEVIGRRSGALNLVQEANGGYEVLLVVAHENANEAAAGALEMSSAVLTDIVENQMEAPIVLTEEIIDPVIKVESSGGAFGSQEEIAAVMQAVITAMTISKMQRTAETEIEKKVAAPGALTGTTAAPDSEYVISGPLTDLTSVMLVGEVVPVQVVNQSHDFNMDYMRGDIVTDPEEAFPLPVIKDMSDKADGYGSGSLSVTVTVENLGGVKHKFTQQVTPFTNLPQSGESRPYIQIKNHKLVELQMQSDLFDTDYTFMRIAYEAIEDKTPMVVYPYVPDTAGGDGSLNLDPYKMNMVAGKRYRLVTMLRRPDATYHNWCTIITADHNPDKPPSQSAVASVTSDSITLVLPSFRGLAAFKISSVVYDGRGDEHRFYIFDGDLDELSRYGNRTGAGEAFQYRIRGLAPGRAYKYAIQTLHNDGRSDRINVVSAVTDTTAFECLVGRSNPVLAPVVKEGTVRSRNFSVEFEEIMTFETPLKYPVNNYTIMLKFLGWCSNESNCETPHAPWEAVARQISVEALDEGVNITGVTSAGASRTLKSCVEAVSSGFFNVKPTGYKGKAFQIYCDVQSDGVWAKILQADTSYTPTEEAVGVITKKGKVSEAAKLSDKQILGLAAFARGNKLWRLGHSSGSLKLYIKSKATFNDTLPSFGFTDVDTTGPTTYASVSSMYNKRGPWSKFEYEYIDTKATTPKTLTDDSCNRFIIGKGVFDCYKQKNASITTPMRCLNGGRDCGPKGYELHENMEMFLYQGSGCPKQCSGHGVCVEGKCRCEEGFEGKACDETTPQSTAYHAGYRRSLVQNSVVQAVTPVMPEHRVGLWNFQKGQNEDPEVMQYIDGNNLVLLQMGVEASQIEETGRMLEASMVGLRPGSSYQVSATAFNAWGESDVGYTSKQIQLDSEPPNAPDMPWFGQEIIGNPTKKVVRRPTIPMTWKAPYHNGAPFTAWVVECTPPMPDLLEDGTSDSNVYPTAPSNVWKRVYMGLPLPNADNPKLRSIVLGEDTLPNATLVPATQYQCRVKGCNGKINGTTPTRCGGWSETADFDLKNEEPEVMPEPTLLDFSVDTAKISWTKPRHNGMPILYYEVRYRTFDLLPSLDGSGCGKSWRWSNANMSHNCPNTTDTKCDLTQLVSGVRYFFSVRAVNCVGSSRWSPPVKVHTPGALPDPPKDPQVVLATAHSLTLQFLPGLDDNGAIPEFFVVEVDNYTQPDIYGLDNSGITAKHCLSYSSENTSIAGTSENLLTWPWCLPEVPPFWVYGGNISDFDANRPYACNIPKSDRYINLEVKNLSPATTYRMRVKTVSDVGDTNWARDYSKVLYQDEFRYFTIGRTMDWTPDEPVDTFLTPVVARTNFTDEFEKKWPGLCSARQFLQGACPGCVKRTYECNFENGTVNTAGCWEQCKQECRDLENTVNTRCYGIAFNPEDDYSPNCILSTIPVGPQPEIFGAGFSCHQHHPQNLTGVYDIDNNTYTVDLQWTDTRDNQGKIVTDYRILTQNITRRYSSATPKALYGPDTEVDYERLSEINNIDAINYRVTQPFNTSIMSTGNVHTLSFGGLSPDQEFNMVVGCINEVGLTNPLGGVRFKTGPGRPEAPRSPTLSSKSGFFMRMRCEEPVALNGGLEILGFTMQMLLVEPPDPTAEEDDELDWSTAATEEFTYGQRYTYGVIGSNSPITVGCQVPSAITDDPFPACLNLASKYAYRCKLRNTLGESAYGDSSTYATAGGSPDTLARALLKREVDPKLYNSGYGFKFIMEMPASNGMSIQHCDLEVGGTWNPEAPVLSPGAPGCTSEICPRVRKVYRKQAPGFEIKDENTMGFRHFRLTVRHSPNTKWCIGGLIIKDIALKEVIPDSCTAFMNDPGPLCSSHEYCSNEGYTTGWAELHFEKNVDPFSYTIVSPSDSSTLPSHVELSISKTGNPDSYRMIHTSILNVTNGTTNRTLLPQERELEKPSAASPPQLSMVTVAPKLGGNATAVTPFLGYVDDDGWLLVLSYHHETQRRQLNPVSMPVDPDAGYSHASLAMLGITEDAVQGVRMKCTSSRHPRVLHYTTREPLVIAVAVRGDNSTSKYMIRATGNHSTRNYRSAVLGMGDFDGQVGEAWHNNASLALDHTARLPMAANIFHPGSGLWNSPFEYETMVLNNRTGDWLNKTMSAWSIGGNGTRWECDDMELVNASETRHDGAETNHQVWVKLKNMEYEQWLPSSYETTCVARPIKDVERLASWEVVDGGAGLDVTLSKGNVTHKSVVLTARSFGLRVPDVFGIVKKVRTEPGMLYTISVFAITNERSNGMVKVTDKNGHNLMKNDAGEAFDGAFFDDTGKRATITFEATGRQSIIVIGFKEGDGSSNYVGIGDTINITAVAMTRTCKEEYSGFYVPPESCGQWARLFSTNATGGGIPPKPEVANLWGQSNKILKITQNYDGSGDKMYIQDQLPSFIADPFYTASPQYQSEDRERVQCSTAEKWHLLKTAARDWDTTSPNNVATAYWKLFDSGIAISNFTEAPSESDMNPCSTQGQSSEEGNELTTFWMCADAAADFTVEPPRIPECIENNAFAAYTKNPAVCGTPYHATLVTLVGQPCEGDRNRVQYNVLHVVDPFPGCDLESGMAVTSFNRADYYDPDDRPGLYYSARSSFLGSPGKAADADRADLCGAPPSIFAEMPAQTCSLSGGNDGVITFIVPDTGAPHLNAPVSPVLDDSPGECVRYCEALSTPTCTHMCDESMRTRTTLPTFAYYFRGRCFNQGGFADWGPWQRQVSSVGIPSQPLRIELGTPTHHNIMVMWDPSEFHNNPYASGFPMIYYEVSYMCIDGVGCKKQNFAPPEEMSEEDAWQESQDLWKEESVMGCRSECDSQGMCRNCTVECLVPFTTYEFRVRAWNGGGYSTFTNDTVTAVMAKTRPTKPLTYQAWRGTKASGGKWASPVTKHSMAKYLNASCPKKDEYDKWERMTTSPPTTELFQQPPDESATNACTVSDDIFELTAAWLLPEISWGTPVVMYRVYVSLEPSYRHPEGKQLDHVPPYGASPYTFLSTTVGGKEPLNMNETLTRVTPSDKLVVNVVAISLLNGIQEYSDSQEVCRITAPPADPCWDGWNEVLGACKEVHYDLQTTPKHVSSGKHQIQVGIVPPVAQNRGREEDNVYELQWKHADISEEQADLCLTPEEAQSPACKEVRSKLFRAIDMPRDEEGNRLVNLTKKHNINVAQGLEDGQAYKLRTRIQVQCEEEEMDARHFHVEYQPDSDYQGDCVLWPTPEPNPNPNRPTPTPQAFAAGERPFPSVARSAIVFSNLPEEVDFQKSYVIRCPYVKKDIGFEFGKAFKLTSTSPVAVYAASRVTEGTPDAPPFCSEFQYPGFRNTNVTVNAQTRSGGMMNFDWHLKRRVFNDMDMVGGKPMYPIEFQYAINSTIVEHPDGYGGVETKCDFADSYSFFVITPLTGTEGCPWTRWTRWSENMEAKSLCPYSEGGKCGGTALDGTTRGLCNETSGECKCHDPEMGKPTWAGPACSTEVEESMCKCVGDPHCTTADGQYFDYSGGGEMKMHHNRMHPDETIHVVLTKVGAVTAIGKVAFKFRDRIITVESHPEGEVMSAYEKAMLMSSMPQSESEANQSNASNASNMSNVSSVPARTCPTVRFNCNKTRVIENRNADPSFSIRMDNSSSGMPEFLEIVTDNPEATNPVGDHKMFCDGNEGSFTIKNHFTKTELQCIRWGGEWKGYFHCYLRYFRDKNRRRGKPLESGLCAYSGSRNARFKETTWEDTIKVDGSSDSLFLSTMSKNSTFYTNKDGYCVDTTKFCSNGAKWDKKPSVSCHDMESDFWLQASVESDGRSSPAMDYDWSRPHLGPMEHQHDHEHISAATASASAGVLSPKRRSLGGTIALLEVETTVQRHHAFKISGGLFDSQAAASHDALATHVGERATNVGRGVVSAAAPGHRLVQEVSDEKHRIDTESLVQTASTVTAADSSAPAVAQTYVQTEAESVDGGDVDEAIQGATYAHVSAQTLQGDDGESADADCVGDYGPCDDLCKKVYSVTSQRVGAGALCPAYEGDVADCQPGEGECPAEADVSEAEPKMTDIECPETVACTNSSCLNAKLLCYRAFDSEGIQEFSSYAGCLADVCIKAPPVEGQGQSKARFWVDQAIKDARVTLAYGDVQAQMKNDADGEEGEDAVATSVPMGGKCPEYSFGKGLWNHKTYQRSVPSWDVGRLATLCCPEGEINDATVFKKECIPYKSFCAILSQTAE